MKHDVSVTIDRIPEYLAEASKRLAAITPCRLSVYGHIGDGNLHYNLLAPVGEDPEAFKRAHARALSECLHDLAAELGGSFSAEHGVGKLKTGRARPVQGSRVAGRHAGHQVRAGSQGSHESREGVCRDPFERLAAWPFAADVHDPRVSFVYTVDGVCLHRRREHPPESGREDGIGMRGTTGGLTVVVTCACLVLGACGDSAPVDPHVEAPATAGDSTGIASVRFTGDYALMTVLGSETRLMVRARDSTDTVVCGTFSPGMRVLATH